MTYALQTLWYDRPRFLPGILAVAFSALLVGVQGGLLLGLFSSASLSIDHTRADVWVGSRGVASVDQGRPLPDGSLAFLACYPEVDHCEAFVQGSTLWVKPDGAAEPCMIIGSHLDDDALGAVRELTPEMRDCLGEPGAVVVDESDLGRLGITGVGATAEVCGQQVRVVGLLRGVRGLANAYVFCSIPTARMLFGLEPGEATFLLARCQDSRAAAALVERFRDDSRLSAFTASDFSRRSRIYWLTKTKAGLALGWSALLGLLLGAAITGQTLYAAAASSLREYAVLRALGIPRWRTALEMISLCLGVGLTGTAIALPGFLAMAGVAGLAGIPLHLPPWLLGGMVVVTLLVALVSGLAGLRLVLSADPATLLR